MDDDPVFQTNRQVYDAMAAAKAPLCRPATDEELARPLKTVDQAGWLGESIAGQKVLCLAAGGGRQSSLYAAAGADVTVVDISGAMLELDRQVAAERGFPLRVLQTSMTDLTGLGEAEFDLVIHPVSTCYVPSILPVYAEVARVLREGGLYISQHKQPVSLQASIEPVASGYTLQHTYYRDQPIPPPNVSNSLSDNSARRLREQGAVEFLHRWEDLLGGLCRSGFVVEDLIEPLHAKPHEPVGSFAHRATYIPPYVRIKARRAGPMQGGEPGRKKLIL